MKEREREREEEILEEDIEEFLKEKERVRNIVGRIGGKVTLVGRVANLFWIMAVVSTFVVSIFMRETLRFTMIEAGVFLVSLKVIYYFNRQAKITHFQFWILSSIEWRLNEVVKKLNELIKSKK